MDIAVTQGQRQIAQKFKAAQGDRPDFGAAGIEGRRQEILRGLNARRAGFLKVKRRQIVKAIIPCREHGQRAGQFRCAIKTAVQVRQNIHLRAGKALVDRCFFRTKRGLLAKVFEHHD